MEILQAFAITLFAGLSTTIGSCLALFSKRNNQKFLAVALGFSAGVMIYVSMIEIFVKAKDNLILALGEKLGSWITIISFFAGIFLIILIDKVLPKEKNVYELSSEKRKKQYIRKVNSFEISNSELSHNLNPTKQKLMRVGIFTALAIGIHNFPEGLATFISALQDPSIGIAVAIAIALHNIPEGIAVSMPIYYATGSRKKGFLYSFLSGLAEPIGAVIGFLILMPFISDMLLGIIFAVVAGIMIFISLDELLPSAREYGKPYLSIYGMIAGMIVMAVSLLLFM